MHRLYFSEHECNYSELKLKQSLVNGSVTSGPWHLPWTWIWFCDCQALGQQLEISLSDGLFRRRFQRCARESRMPETGL